MRVLFISKDGDGITVAQRLVLEGHKVDFWCRDAKFADAGKGIVTRVPEWQGAALRRADLVIADSVGLGRYADAVSKVGRPMLGFSPELDALELNRAKGAELFQRAGIDTPETIEWTSPAEARRIPSSQGWGDGWVIKASGNLSAEKTAVVKDEEQWDRAVRQLPPTSHGIVQRVVSGVEVSTEGWFNGSSFIKPFNHTFEDKRFLAGDLGQNTGCMGNIVIRADSNKLTKATVERVAPFLRVIGYRGPFDINCIVNQDGAFALEATSRMGYDAVEALIEGLEEPAGDFLFDVAIGTKREMTLTADTMISVRLSIPPWPFRAPDRGSGGEPVLGITEESLPHLFLADMQKVGDAYTTAGCDGVILKATAIGRVTPAKPLSGGRTSRPDYTYEARRRVYRTLERIQVQHKQYRIDIGGRANEDIAKLKEWGWL